MSALTMSELVLALDLGTSGPKVGLLTMSGVVLATEFVPTQTFFLAGGGAEQDPAEWWSALTTACNRLLASTPAAVDSIVAVSVTSQWSVTVPVDKDGEPLHRAISWMDTRGAPHLNRRVGGLIEIDGYGILKAFEWLRLTGGAPGHAGKDSLAHMLFLKAEKPEIYRAAWKLIEAKDYLNFKLTGRCIGTVEDATLTWVTDTRDINNVRYHPRLFKLAGIDRDKLPDLIRAIDIVGPLRAQAAKDLGVKAGIPVIAGAVDMHSAAVGAGTVRDFEPHLYVGTSSWLTCHVPYKRTDLLHNMATLPAALPGRYLLTNEQETAGACLRFLRDNLMFPDDALQTGTAPQDFFVRLDRVAAQAAPGSDKLIFAPWLYGERTPVEDANLRGAFFNLSMRTSRPQLFRSVLEGVAYNARWLLANVERFVRRRFAAINIIGGGAQSTLWCQIIADVLDRPIRQVKDPVNANLRGAAFLAGLALGEIDVNGIAETVQIDRVFAPNGDTRRIYDELFAEFLAFGRQNRASFRRLNGQKRT
jgi:xylulokinase